MNKTDKQEWKEKNTKKQFYERAQQFEFPREQLNPSLLGKRSLNRVPVKDLPFHLRHARGIQYAILGVTALMLFSKPIYEIYAHYSGKKSLKRSDIQLHPPPK